MEQNHFMQSIEETYHSLTKVEKKVADYVLPESPPGIVLCPLQIWQMPVR